MDDSEPPLLRCEYCPDRFKRADHLRRHGLSHQGARFTCAHAGCEMRFHRKDVMKRHMLVHLPDPRRKRRKPRRGPVPPQLDCVDGQRPALHDEPEDNGQLPALHSNSGNDTGIAVVTPDADFSPLSPFASFAPLAPSVSYSSPVSIPDVSLNNLQQPSPECWAFCDGHSSWTPEQKTLFRFCVSHFHRFVTWRYPFCHPASWTKPVSGPSRYLAMAALGAWGVQEYRPSSRQFFEEAITCWDLRRPPSPGTVVGMLDQSSRETVLADFQTQLLLVDYALWSEDAGLECWARHRISVLLNENVPVLLQHYHLAATETDWQLWLYAEEAKRSLWALYCILVKAVYCLGHSLMWSNEIDSLDLPCSDSVFRAPDELTWRVALDENNGSLDQPVSFRQALYSLMTSDANMGPVHEACTSVFGQQILLCGVLEALCVSTKTPLEFDSFEAYAMRDLAGLRLAGQFLKALTTWRSLWWVSLECLWDGDGRGTVQIQSILLLYHLEVLMLGLGQTKNIGQEEECTMAAGIAVDLICSISKNGYVNVATRAPWLLDGASHYFTGCLAQTGMRWVQDLLAREVRNPMSVAEQGIFNRLLQALRRYPLAASDTRSTIPREKVCGRLLQCWEVILGPQPWFRRNQM